MGRYVNNSKNNFENELMKVYGHCFANGCYDYKENTQEKCNDKCYEGSRKHDNDKCEDTEKEVRNIFKFIFDELNEIECDLEKVEKALKRLFYLLNNDCTCDDKKEDFKCLAEDLKALNHFLNKTKQDLKCLAKKTL